MKRILATIALVAATGCSAHGRRVGLTPGPTMFAPPVRTPYGLAVTASGATLAQCRAAGSSQAAESGTKLSPHGSRATGMVGASPVRHECRAGNQTAPEAVVWNTQQDGSGTTCAPGAGCFVVLVPAVYEWSPWILEADVTCLRQAIGTSCPGELFARAPDPPAALPDAPQNVALIASPALGAQFIVTWEKVWNADQYEIQYATSSSGPWTVYGRTANGEQTSAPMVHRRAGTVVLQGSTTYWVRVRAINAAGMSAVPAQVAAMPETQLAEGGEVILAILATVFTTFTVPTHNQGAPAMPQFIQTRTCNPFVSDCHLVANWTGTDTSPIGTVRPCNVVRPRITAGDVCCLQAATPRREEMLYCGPVAYNKDLLFARRVCRTGSDSVVRCSVTPDGSEAWAREPSLVCSPLKPGGGCPCAFYPSVTGCVP